MALTAYTEMLRKATLLSALTPDPPGSSVMAISIGPRKSHLLAALPVWLFSLKITIQIPIAQVPSIRLVETGQDAHTRQVL